MRGWRIKGSVAAVALAVFFVIQLSIPITRFGNHEVTQRFAWQMFAGFVPAPQFVVLTPDGDRDVALDDFMAWPRADIDIVAYLPAHLCDVVHDALAVTWETGSLTC